MLQKTPKSTFVSHQPPPAHVCLHQCTFFSKTPKYPLLSLSLSLLLPLTKILSTCILCPTLSRHPRRSPGAPPPSPSNPASTAAASTAATHQIPPPPPPPLCPPLPPPRTSEVGFGVRVSPVLNVPICQIRGSTKSGSVFGFFSKKEKEVAAKSNGKRPSRDCVLGKDFQEISTIIYVNFEPVKLISRIYGQQIREGFSGN